MVNARRRFGEAPTAREVAAPPLYRLRETTHTITLPDGRRFVLVRRSRAGGLQQGMVTASIPSAGGDGCLQRPHSEEQMLRAIMLADGAGPAGGRK